MSTRPPPRRSDESAGSVFAAGVAAFAGVMLATVSVFQVLQAVAAIGEDDIYVRGREDYVWAFDVSTWGWVHLVIGVIGLAAGIGILTGQTWARVIGIVIAVLGCVTNFVFLPYYPFWAIVVLAFNVLVIWALCTRIARD
ncbi:hypothetical protein [Nocardioides sp. zg-DK7169]|uniref:DUF7144 family membrane protein n=1 Tax=Nocardioides sp. zg-DK7169 TaxID=2736600 RepID=UPI001553ED9A|nr:hypothetical protein [Nocardioides sp. zg-DK7169]NPC96831.1 hypothetical protein [Nocardioides sp. zg-DK7169]